MGERKLAAVKVMNAVAGACQEAIDLADAGDDAMRVRTPGGAPVRWDERGSATAFGKLSVN